jgi:hypothetical protein
MSVRTADEVATGATNVIPRRVVAAAAVGVRVLLRRLPLLRPAPVQQPDLGRQRGVRLAQLRHIGLRRRGGFLRRFRLRDVAFQLPAVQALGDRGATEAGPAGRSVSPPAWRRCVPNARRR